MPQCRHLNADEFQFVANGSNIEIGNFLQDGAKRSLLVNSLQAGWSHKAILVNAAEGNAEVLHQEMMSNAEEKLHNTCATLGSGL